MSTNNIRDFAELLSSKICENRQLITDRVLDSIFLTNVLHNKNRVAVETDESAVAQYQVGRPRSAVQGQSTKFAWTTLWIDVSFAAQELTDNSDSVTQRKLLDAKICRVKQSMRVLLERAVIRELVSVLEPLRNISMANPEEVSGYGAITYGSATSSITQVQLRVYTPDEIGVSTSRLTEAAIERIFDNLDDTHAKHHNVVFTSKKQWRHLSNDMRTQHPEHSTRPGDIGIRHFIVEGMPVFYLPDDYVSGRPSSERPWREDNVAVLNTNCLKLVLRSSGLQQCDSFQRVQCKSEWQAVFGLDLKFQWIGCGRQAIIRY